MKTIDVPLETLDAARFRIYGTVIEPHWKAETFTMDNRQVSLGFSVDGTADFYISRYYKTDGLTSKFERHMAMTETRVSLGEPVVFFVAGNPAEDGLDALPDPATVRAFRIEPNHGVMLRRSTWHSMSFPLAANHADFAFFAERESENEIFSGKNPREFRRTQILDYALERRIQFRIAPPSRS
jgi:ureidoglycolate hydrolase